MLLTWPQGVGGNVLPGFFTPLQAGLSPISSGGSSTPTFTRASTAYQQDFELKQNIVLSGEVRFQGARREQNIVSTTSEVFTNGAWTATNTTVAAEATIVDPKGGTATYSVTATATNGLMRQDVGSQTGNTVNNAIYVMRKTGTGIINLYQTDGTAIDITASLSTTTWKRFSGGATAGGANTYVGVQIATSTDAVYVFGAMIQNVTGRANQIIAEYISVGVAPYNSAPFNGANKDTVKYFSTLNGNTVSSNVVTEATGAQIVTGASGVSATAPVDASGPFGYLAEGARADVLGTTAAIRRTMSAVGWVISGLGADYTVTTSTGVDGVAASCARLTCNTNNGTILYTPGLAGADRTYSCWVKRISGSGAVQLTGDGTNFTTKTITTAFTQIQIDAGSVVPIVGIKMAAAGDVIDVDFNTLEAAPFANLTPIPVNVSKAADILTYPTSGNANGTTGSMYAEFTMPNSSVNNYLANFNSAGNVPPIYVVTGNKLGMFDGVNLPSDLSTGTPSTPVKVAVKWSGVLWQDFLSGTAGTASAFAGFSLGTNMAIGTLSAAGDSLFGTLRNVRIYPQALSAGQLQAMTT